MARLTLVSDHSHGEGVPLDENGNCATCHQPIKARAESKPTTRAKRSRVVILEPLGEEGTLEDLLFQLGERWSPMWPTLAPGTPGWKYRVSHAALYEVLRSGVMPIDENQP